MPGLVNVDLGTILSGAGNLAKELREAITGKSIIDPNKQAELTQRAQEIEYELIKAQAEINKAEAGTGSLFIAGWRPFVGWICAFSFGWAYLFGPVGVWIAGLMGHTTQLPAIAAGSMVELLVAMLGLSGYRTYEKLKSAEGNR